MRKYEIEGRIESLKTLPTEVTIKEFELITKAQEENVGSFMQYLDSFEILGLSSEFIDIIDDKTLYMLIKDFQDDFIINNKDYKRTIEIDGYTYSAFQEGGEFKLGARDLANIEQKLAKDQTNWISYAMAIIFKRDDLSSVEHKASAHIKHKEKLFQGVSMDVAMPYIMYISESYINSIKVLTELDKSDK